MEYLYLQQVRWAASAIIDGEKTILRILVRTSFL